MHLFERFNQYSKSDGRSNQLKSKVEQFACSLFLLLICAGSQANILEESGMEAYQPGEEVSSEWRFRVFLDRKEIGFHDYRITGSGEQRRVDTIAEFDVKILFLNAYRYRHKNIELWNSGCLSSIDSVTDANGDDFIVKGAIDDNNFVVSDGSDTKRLPNCIKSFAYWNPEFLNASNLLNAQTGELEPVDITFEKQEVVQFNGAEINAHRYLVKAKSAEITLWYASDDSRWLALQSLDRDGRTIRYEPLVLPASS